MSDIQHLEQIAKDARSQYAEETNNERLANAFLLIEALAYRIIALTQRLTADV